MTRFQKSDINAGSRCASSSRQCGNPARNDVTRHRRVLGGIEPAAGLHDYVCHAGEQVPRRFPVVGQIEREGGALHREGHQTLAMAMAEQFQHDQKRAFR